jgi:hypothetical protein
MLDMLKLCFPLLVLALAACQNTGPKGQLRGEGAKADFERLKALDGKWEGTFSSGGVTGDVSVAYHVTGAGSVVMETLFAGTEHEMVTAYHLDGDRLMLTHYCAAQNQPRMVMVGDDDPEMLSFKFIDGTGMKSTKDSHMHSAKIWILGEDKLRSQWTNFTDGEAAHIADFTLERD